MLIDASPLEAKSNGERVSCVHALTILSDTFMSYIHFIYVVRLHVFACSYTYTHVAASTCM